MTREEAISSGNDLYIIPHKKFRQMFMKADIQPLRFYPGSYKGNGNYIHASRIKFNNVSYQIDLLSWPEHCIWHLFSKNRDFLKSKNWID